MSWYPFLLICGYGAGLAFILAVLVGLLAQPLPRSCGFEVKRDD